MKTFSKVEYVDAFYISEDTLENIELYPNVAYGSIFEKNDKFIVLSFVNRRDSKNYKCIVSQRGLLIPNSALTANYKNIDNSIFVAVNVGNNVSIEWDDILYFENISPSSQTKMYTEGIVIMKTETFLVVKDPITIRIKPLPIKNHPEYTPFYYVIPLSFIKKIEIL